MIFVLENLGPIFCVALDPSKNTLGINMLDSVWPYDFTVVSPFTRTENFTVSARKSLGNNRFVQSSERVFTAPLKVNNTTIRFQYQHETELWCSLVYVQCVWFAVFRYNFRLLEYRIDIVETDECALTTACVSRITENVTMRSACLTVPRCAPYSTAKHTRRKRKRHHMHVCVAHT